VDEDFLKEDSVVEDAVAPELPAQALWYERNEYNRSLVTSTASVIETVLRGL
jgi:hypothetical protein